MKIARAVLELNVESHEWTRAQMRRHMLDKEFVEADYTRRIQAIIDMAEASGVSHLALPAYSIPVGCGSFTELKWANIVKRSGLAGFTAGAVSPQKPSPRELYEEENIFAVDQGSLVPLPYGPLPLMLGGLSTVTAISSSVGEVRDYPQVFAASAQCSGKAMPLVIFDMGHDQYTGQYVKTLTTVVRAAQDLGALRVVLLLAFWRWRGGTTSSAWAFENDVALTTFTRRDVPVGDGRTDYLDIFSV